MMSVSKMIFVGVFLSVEFSSLAMESHECKNHRRIQKSWCASVCDAFCMFNEHCSRAGGRFCVPLCDELTNSREHQEDVIERQMALFGFDLDCRAQKRDLREEKLWSWLCCCAVRPCVCCTFLAENYIEKNCIKPCLESADRADALYHASERKKTDK